LLLAALMRLPALDRAPPGWRDDELIEIEMDSRIEQGWRPLYIREAEGHEPLYHYLHAGTLWLFGHNLYGYRWLPAATGTLSTALLIALTRRLFGFRAAVLTGVLYSVGFWPVMYSRFGVRHIGMQPFILLALFALAHLLNTQYRLPKSRSSSWYWVLGIAMGLGLYVYYAAWVMPALTMALGGYLFVFDRPRFKRTWRALMLALVIAAAIFFPLGWDLTHGPQVTRIQVTGAPLRALLSGDLRPAFDTTLGTLGMFTFAGDPEWLYNYSGLPVFDWITGAAFYLGVVLCVMRMRDARYGLAFLWLIVGLSPAFISIPAASYSHTFAAQGAVYLMPALALAELSNTNYLIPNTKLKLCIGYWVFILLIAWNVNRTREFYFARWAAHPLVRLQYHADTRELARWLDQRQDSDIAISTSTHQLALDALALSFDLKRQDVEARWFDAAWALVLPRGGGQRILIPNFLPGLHPLLEASDITTRADASLSVGERYRDAALRILQPDFSLYQDAAPIGSHGQSPGDAPRFGDRLTLITYTLPIMPAPGRDGWLLTTWRVDGPLNDSLKLFVHLLDADGRAIGGDDRFDVLASSLRPGDVFIQVSRVPRPTEPGSGSCAPCRIEIGWYDPRTNERLRTMTSDHLMLPLEVQP